MQSQQPKESSDETSYSIDLNELPQPQLSGHGWRQQGTMLVCETCPFTHTSYIPPEYQLYGIDAEGMPLIRKLEL